MSRLITSNALPAIEISSHWSIEACFKVYRLTQIDNIHVKAWWSTDSPRRLQQSANWENKWTIYGGFGPHKSRLFWTECSDSTLWVLIEIPWVLYSWLMISGWYHSVVSGLVPKLPKLDILEHPKWLPYDFREIGPTWNKCIDLTHDLVIVSIWTCKYWEVMAVPGRCVAMLSQIDMPGPSPREDHEPRMYWCAWPKMTTGHHGWPNGPEADLISGFIWVHYRPLLPAVVRWSSPQRQTGFTSFAACTRLWRSMLGQATETCVQVSDSTTDKVTDLYKHLRFR